MYLSNFERNLVPYPRLKYYEIWNLPIWSMTKNELSDVQWFRHIVIMSALIDLTGALAINPVARVRCDYICSYIA